MFVEKSDCSVLMIGDCPVTTTVSACPAIPSETSMDVIRPTSTTTFSCLNDENPSSEAVTL